MPALGKLLLIIGVIMVLLGLILIYFGNSFNWFGHLPGDLRVKREGFSFYFPLTSMLLLSFIISAAFWLIKRFL